MDPYLNGKPYRHKPPLFFWLMHLRWAVFGVNASWPRLLVSLFGRPRPRPGWAAS
jgi:4-amino-4-deoxy-L-arabinose transferase-like glycosyltransferase